jgi:predicted HTH domain antitoxin
MRRIDSEIEIQIIDLYTRKKFSLGKISKQLNISPTAVRNALERNGISRRGISESSKKYSLDINYFSKIGNHTKAQILGMIYADGCICINSKKWRSVFQIGLSIVDIEYVEFIKKELKYTGPITSVLPSKNAKLNTSVRANLVISDPRLVEDLIFLSVTPRKSLTTTFPNFSQVPYEFINSFILGYLEGDGGIYTYPSGKITPKMVVKFNLTQEFGYELQKLLNVVLNISSTLKLEPKYKNVENPPNVYNLIVTGPQQVKKLLDWLYKDVTFTMKRKFEVYEEIKNFLQWREENWEKIRQESYVKMANTNRGRKRPQEFCDKMSKVAKKKNLAKNFKRS